jgi:hypothetical protein
LADKEPNKTVRINTHEITPPEEPPSDTMEDAAPPIEEPELGISVNNVLWKVCRDAHPGDPRHVLGSDKKSYLMAMVHRLSCDNNSDDSDAESIGYNSYWRSGFSPGRSINVLQRLSPHQPNRMDARWAHHYFNRPTGTF